MSQSDTPQNNDMVLGGSMDPMQASYQQYYPAEQPAARSKPTIDSTESARMTPLIMAFLIIAGIKRNWKWALPTGLIGGAVAATLLYFLFPGKYQATAYIQILTQRPYFIYNETERMQYKQYVQTQFAIMRSPLIIDKALEDPEVARLATIQKQKNKAGWLAKSLKMGNQGDSEMITISIETEEKNDADKIVNAVVTAFFVYYAGQSSDWNQKLITQLNLEYNRQQAAARLLQDEIRTSMEEAAKQGGAAGSEGGLSGGFAQSESLMRDVYLQESRLTSLRAELKMLRESAEGGAKISQTMLLAAIQNDPELMGMNNQLAVLKENVRQLKQVLPRDDDPKILGYEQRIQELEKNMEASFEDISNTKLQGIQMAIQVNLDQQIMEKDMAVRSQEILVADLKEKYKEQLVTVGDRTTKVADVSFQQAQLRRVDSVLDLLQARITKLETERYAPEQIQLRKKAQVPSEANDKKRIPMAAMGGIAFLCFPLFLGIAIERLKPRLYHVSQIRRAIPSVIIGEIMEPPVAWVHGATFRKRLARYRESVHNWCTHLLLSDPFRNCRTLSVASVSGDDGKTFLAVQVAVAMAQMKSGPVLLIDADMRVGRLHLLFGNEETGVGLADVLSFRNGFGEAVVLNEREPNLHLLSAGQLDTSPYELLGDGRFKELLDTLENHYSLILVVLPPVANAAESLVMAASTNSVLLCVRQGETVLAAMEDVFRKLINTGSSVDGIVVKDIPYYQMAGKDGGFADKLEQIRLAHLLQYAD